MGDISEMRGVVVLFTIISVTISLILLIPSEFYSSSASPATSPNADINPLIAWNNTYVANLTYNAFVDTSTTFSINGYNYGINVYPGGEVNIHTYESWWVFEWGRDDFKWYHLGVIKSEPLIYLGVTFEGVKSSTVDSIAPPQKFSLKNSKTKTDVTLVFNTTAYGSWDAALKANAGSVVFQIDWNDRNTSMNALQLVGMVLTASLPNVHPVLNGVFALFGWGLIAAGVYLAFIFTLRIVGAVFGGGGA